MLKPHRRDQFPNRSAKPKKHSKICRADTQPPGAERWRLGLFAILALAQSATAVAVDKIIDFSAYPEMSQERTIPLIAKGLRDNLLDAGSVTNFSACYPPVKVKFKDGKPVRWTVMLSLNSKNSLGGYTGLQQMAAIFYADKPVSIVSTGMPPSSKQLAACTRVPDAKIRQLIQGE